MALTAKENGQQGAYAKPQAHSPETGTSDEQTGLTKREAFAMAALQGYASTGRTLHEAVAVDCVQAADALLAELAKEV